MDDRFCRYFFFFFQAEDGIRDGHVTGVQTCALPISARSTTPADSIFIDCARSILPVCRAGTKPISSVVARHTRSEERRVGKECRSRWSEEDSKKNEESTVCRRVKTEQPQKESSVPRE